MKPSRMITALLILTSLSALIHRYVWIHLVRNADWPAPWGRAFTVLLCAFAVMIPLVFLTMRSAPRAWNTPFSWVVYSWMGFLFYLLLFSALDDAGRGAAYWAGVLPHDPARRIFLARTLALGIAVLAAGVGLWGIFNVSRGFKVTRVRVPLAKFPKNIPGYGIVQITDVHVGPTLGRAFVESIVRETNALRPDLIVLTGDLVDGTVEQLQSLVAPLRDLQAADGIFFVTGNHEYYSGADAWIAHLQTLGIRVLRNERVDIRGLFDLAGVDDASAARMLPRHGQDIAKALAGRDVSRALVLLAHQPKAFPEAARAGVDLQLSGHVHGGQMFPFNWLVRLEQPYISGLYQAGQARIYVSAGTGYWGPPMRVGTRSEITRIEIVPDAEA